VCLREQKMARAIESLPTIDQALDERRRKR
jgi:hypothetical protein